MSSDARLIAAIHACETWSAINREMNAEALLRLRDVTGFASIEDALSDPEETMRRLAASRTKRRRTEYSLRSTGRFVMAASSALMRVPEAIGDGGRARAEEWKELARQLSREIVDTRALNAPTERQARAMRGFEWRDLLEIRDRIPRPSQIHLLFAMYTMLPPVRNDLWRCRMYAGSDRPPDPEAGNYVLLETRELVLNEYKTARMYGQNRIEIPAELMDVILEISRARGDLPPYLFLNRRCLPFNTESGFSGWAGKVLKLETGRPEMTLTMIRHLYLSSGVCLSRLPVPERMRIARIMGHTLSAQNDYVLREPVVEADDDALETREPMWNCSR